MPKRPPTTRGADAAPTDDALAFRDAVRDVKPLAHAPVRSVAQGLQPSTRVRGRARRPSRDESAQVAESMPLIAAGQGDESASGPAAFKRAGVRDQVMRRLRRGLIPVEDELDLHGHTQLAARDQLAEFLVRSRLAGRRCVRVVHGKGYRSGARGPVLKIAVDLWLRRHFDVLAFTSARAIDGGTGAVYVLLRT